MKEGEKVASGSCVKIGQIRIGSYDFDGNMDRVSWDEILIRWRLMKF